MSLHSDLINLILAYLRPRYSISQSDIKNDRGISQLTINYPHNSITLTCRFQFEPKRYPDWPGNIGEFLRLVAENENAALLLMGTIVAGVVIEYFAPTLRLVISCKIGNDTYPLMTAEGEIMEQILNWLQQIDMQRKPNEEVNTF